MCSVQHITLVTDAKDINKERYVLSMAAIALASSLTQVTAVYEHRCYVTRHKKLKHYLNKNYRSFCTNSLLLLL